MFNVSAVDKHYILSLYSGGSRGKISHTLPTRNYQSALLLLFAFLSSEKLAYEKKAFYYLIFDCLFKVRPGSTDDMLPVA